MKTTEIVHAYDHLTPWADVRSLTVSGRHYVAKCASRVSPDQARLRGISPGYFVTYIPADSLAARALGR